MSRKDPEPIRITSASSYGRSADVAGRERRYLISMAIRTACFLLAVVFAGTVWMWFFILGSFILPPVAVVVANAQANTDPDGAPDTAFDPGRPELGPPPTR